MITKTDKTIQEFKKFYSLSSKVLRVLAQFIYNQTAGTFASSGRFTN